MSSQSGEGSMIGWITAGIPAVLAWAAYGLGYLLDPHLTEVAVNPLHWAGYAAAGWYAIVGFCLAMRGGFIPIPL